MARWLRATKAGKALLQPPPPPILTDKGETTTSNLEGLQFIHQLHPMYQLTPPTCVTQQDGSPRGMCCVSGPRC